MDIETIIEEHELMKLALDEICRPIIYMQNRLLEDEELNSHYALQMAKDGEYLKNIAQKCYNKLSK